MEQLDVLFLIGIVSSKRKLLQFAYRSGYMQPVLYSRQCDDDDLFALGWPRDFIMCDL